MRLGFGGRSVGFSGFSGLGFRVHVSYILDQFAAPQPAAKSPSTEGFRAQRVVEPYLVFRRGP